MNTQPANDRCLVFDRCLVLQPWVICGWLNLVHDSVTLCVFIVCAFVCLHGLVLECVCVLAFVNVCDMCACVCMLCIVL